MRRVGTVVRTAQGVLLARTDDDAHPDVGEEVVDDGLDPVGRVVDVIGPVARPYVVIAPEGRDSVASLLNERLYVR